MKTNDGGPQTAATLPPLWRLPAGLDKLETNVAVKKRPPREGRPSSEWEKHADRLAGFYEHAPPRIHEAERMMRHRGAEKDRKRLREGLEAAGMGDARMERYGACGADAWVQAEKSDGRLRISCWRCRDRWCPTCGRHRASRIAERIGKLAEGRDCRFITLTQVQKYESLPKSLDRLYLAFRRLRASREWKARVSAAAVITELKVSKKTGCWHVHLHIIAAGLYWERGLLRKAWGRASEGAKVADIRRIDDTGQAVSYVAKYASKPLDRTVLRNPKALVAAIRSLHGRRLCGLLGDWRGHKLAVQTRPSGEWRSVMRVVDAICRAADGDAFAGRLLGLLRDRIGDAAGWADESAVEQWFLDDPPAEAERRLTPK